MCDWNAAIVGDFEEEKATSNGHLSNCNITPPTGLFSELQLAAQPNLETFFIFFFVGFFEDVSINCKYESVLGSWIVHMVAQDGC